MGHSYIFSARQQINCAGLNKRKITEKKEKKKERKRRQQVELPAGVLFFVLLQSSSWRSLYFRILHVKSHLHAMPHNRVPACPRAPRIWPGTRRYLDFSRTLSASSLPFRAICLQFVSFFLVFSLFFLRLLANYLQFHFARKTQINETKAKLKVKVKVRDKGQRKRDTGSAGK